MFKKRDRNEVRVIRHARVRKKISGTPEMPRLCVYRSNKYIYAQVIDDTKGITLVQASSLDPALKGQLDEVDCVARNTDGQLRVFLRMVHRIQKQILVEHVHVEMVTSVRSEVAVHQVHQILYLRPAVLAQSGRTDGEGVGNAVLGVLERQFRN